MRTRHAQAGDDAAERAFAGAIPSDRDGASAAPLRVPEATDGAIEDEDALELPPEEPGDDSEMGYDEAEDAIEGDEPSGDDALDDDLASDLDTGVELEALPDATEPDDAEAIEEAPDDIGITFDDAVEAADDVDGLGRDEADALAFDEHGADDDGGVEGVDDPAADEVDESDLPELDADENDTEGEALFRDLMATSVAELPVPPLDGVPWRPLDGAGAPVPCSAVAVGDGRVAASGTVLLVVDEGAHAAKQANFGTTSAAVTFLDGRIVCATVRGQLFTADGGGGTRPIAAWRARPVSAVCATEGRLWIAAEGALWRMTRAPEAADGSLEAPVAARDAGVVAIAATRGVLVALTQISEELRVERLRADDEVSAAIPLATPTTNDLRLAAADGGAALAIADGGRVLVSRDGGATFRTFDLPPVAALAFAGDAEDAPLLAVVAGSLGEIGHLVQLPAVGEASTLAHLGTESDDDVSGPAAMAWDATREVVWIASRGGLVAYGRATRH